MDFQQIRKYVKGVLTNSFLNKTTLDKLSTSDEGNLLFDGKELKNMGNVEASITELWSGQQSVSAEITLLDDYANYDIIVSMIEPLEDYPTQQKFDFMLKGAESLTGGMAENNSYIASYRLNNWNGTSVYFRRDNNPSGWNFTLRKIWGIKFVSQQHEYSTEEQIVGKWIEGKKIKEKTFIISDFDFSQSKDFTNDIFTEIELIIDAKMYDTTSSTVRFIHVDARKISSNTIRLYNKDNWSSIDTYTLQYTKTTD